MAFTKLDYAPFAACCIRAMRLQYVSASCGVRRRFWVPKLAYDLVGEVAEAMICMLASRRGLADALRAAMGASY